MFSWSRRLFLKQHFSGVLKHLFGEGRKCSVAASTMARIVEIDSSDLARQVSLAAQSLVAGNVIAVPTDTIYGVAVLAQNSEAITKLYNVKRRQISKAVAISVGDIDDVYKWGKVTVSRDVLCDLLPGPVTLVFDRTPQLNPDLNEGTSSVGIRIPDYDFVRSIAQVCGGPIALTSANISSEQSSLCVQEFKSLWPQLDLVFDGGRIGDTAESRFGSTVVDLTTPDYFRVIREGSAYKPTVDVLVNKHNLRQVKR